MEKPGLRKRVGRVATARSQSAIVDCGVSIRVPHSFVNNGYKRHLEDRRPKSQGGPYRTTSQILKTIASVLTSAKKKAA